MYYFSNLGKQKILMKFFGVKKKRIKILARETVDMYEYYTFLLITTVTLALPSLDKNLQMVFKNLFLCSVTRYNSEDEWWYLKQTEGCGFKQSGKQTAQSQWIP